MGYISFRTAIGDLTLFDEAGEIVSLEWGWVPGRKQTPLLIDVVEVVREYFVSGRISVNVPLRPKGTEFQLRVWAAVQALPSGQTMTYTDLARVVESGPRAVAGACSRNPIPILIPCHRVVGIVTLGGYSGEGGCQTKRTLLQLEGSQTSQSREHV